MQPDNQNKGQDHDDRRDRAAVHQWLNHQRGKRAFRPPPKAGHAVSKIMAPLSRKFGAGRSGLNEHWEQIVGARFARISTPVRFLGGKNGRTLLISAPGPAAALIMAAGNSIIDRANGYLGPGYIRHIKVVQTKMRDGHLAGSKQMKSVDLTPRQAEELNLSLEKISNPDLKEALEELGRQVYSRSNRD